MSLKTLKLMYKYQDAHLHKYKCIKVYTENSLLSICLVYINQNSLFLFLGAQSYQSSFLRTGHVGRQRRDITIDQLNFLLSLNFTACQIGDIMGVSCSTIKNRLRLEKYFTLG